MSRTRQEIIHWKPSEKSLSSSKYLVFTGFTFLIDTTWLELRTAQKPNPEQDKDERPVPGPISEHN